MTQTDFEPNLSFVTLADDGYTLQLNGESNYSVRLPLDISRKKAAEKQNAIESTILNACNSFGVDYVSMDNIKRRAKEIVDLLDKRWAIVRGEKGSKKSRPKVTSPHIIGLEISESLRNKGFRLFRDDSYIFLRDRKGNHAHSYIYKGWEKTHKEVRRGS